jgi:hypothetical protein
MPPAPAPNLWTFRRPCFGYPLIDYIEVNRVELSSEKIYDFFSKNVMQKRLKLEQVSEWGI